MEVEKNVIDFQKSGYLYPTVNHMTLYGYSWNWYMRPRFCEHLGASKY